MFRDNQTHRTEAKTSYDLVYDTKAWRFDAGAPVRSTALVHGDVLYFGNTRGDFFALDKKTGSVIWQYHTGFAINASAACQGGTVFFLRQ